mgnify:CR=1 FL=1|jgi:hypothetical protein
MVVARSAKDFPVFSVRCANDLANLNDRLPEREGVPKLHLFGIKVRCELVGRREREHVTFGTDYLLELNPSREARGEGKKASGAVRMFVTRHENPTVIVVLARTRLVADGRNFGFVNYSRQLVGGVPWFHNGINAVRGLESEPQAERSWVFWVSQKTILQELVPPLFWGVIQCTNIFRGVLCKPLDIRSSGCL